MKVLKVQLYGSFMGDLLQPVKELFYTPDKRVQARIEFIARLRKPHALFSTNGGREKDYERRVRHEMADKIEGAMTDDKLLSIEVHSSYFYEETEVRIN